MRMTARSSLVLQGDVCIAGKVEIDGALVIKAAPGPVCAPDCPVSRVRSGLLPVSSCRWRCAACKGSCVLAARCCQTRGLACVARQESCRPLLSAPAAARALAAALLLQGGRSAASNDHTQSKGRRIVYVLEEETSVCARGGEECMCSRRRIVHVLGRPSAHAGPRAFWLDGVCKGGQLSKGRRA